jgi:16S rRNA (uracil1498-N3)-methyltransferase
MARRRFFVPEIRGGTAELTGPDAEHLVRVLRAEVGQLYELSDNRDLYLARIEVARKSVVSFRIVEKLDTPAATVSLALVAALIKFDRFEWLVEKATELGVSLIQPFETARTEPGLALAANKRRARWEKIAREASQQSRRIHLPHIGPVTPFTEALRAEANLRLLLDEDPAAPPILERLPEQRSLTDRVALFSGPEGGWTDNERQRAIGAGWKPCSLGTTILRAETAGIAGLAILQAAWLRNPTK